MIRLKLILPLAFLAIFFLAGCDAGVNDNKSVRNTKTDNPASETGTSDPQTVKFESADNVEIVGTYYESDKANAPGVLLLHQWGSDRSAYTDYALSLRSKGLAVLAIDGRGFGESVKTTAGKPIGPERTDDAVKGMMTDVDKAFKFLADKKNVDGSRIAIVGASYGSSLALMYAAENKDVQAAVLLSPGLNYFGNMPTEPAVKNFGDRSLLMVSAEDDKASADSVRKLEKAVENNNYEIKIYPKGGHGTNIFGAKVGLAEVIDKFLIKNLMKSGD